MKAAALAPRETGYGDAAGHSCIAVTGPARAFRNPRDRVADREENVWLFAQKTLEVFEQVVRGAG